MAELVATEKKSLGQILKDKFWKGRPANFYTDRIEMWPFRRRKRRRCWRNLRAAWNTSIGPFKVGKFITTDGYKFLLPNREWVAFRASGTEPLIRCCYIEAAKTMAHLKKLRQACRDLLK